MLKTDKLVIRFIPLVACDGGVIYYDEKAIKEEVYKLPEGIPKAYIRYLECKCNELEVELKRKEMKDAK